MDEIKKSFPKYIDKSIIPVWAKEQSFEVYRACRSGKVDQLSFMNSFEENGFMVSDNVLEDLGKYRATAYSLSTYTKIRDVKRFMTMTSDFGVPFIIAKGTTEPTYGVCIETRFWKKQLGDKCKSSHVDWWLYEGATPWLAFKEVDYDENPGDTSSI